MEFQDKFQKWLPEINFNEFDTSENDALNRLLEIWLHFTYHYEDKFTNPQQAAHIIFEGKLQDRRKNLNKVFIKLTKQGIKARILSETILWDDVPTLWITFDIQDPLRLWTSYDQVLQSISPAIQWGSDRTAQAIIGLRWSNIIVVPTIRGKSLLPQAWVLASIHLYDNQSLLKTGNWRYFLRDVPQDTWTQLQLETWVFSPVTLAFQKVHVEIAQLAQAYSLLSNLLSAPEPTEVGADITQSYGTEWQAIAESLCNSAVVAVNNLQSLCEDQLELQDLVNGLIAVLQEQVQLIEDFFPTEDALILETWKLRSAEILEVLEVIRLRFYTHNLAMN